MATMKTTLGLMCLFLGSCCSSVPVSALSAPRPCVVLQADPDQGSLTVAQGCVLIVWREQEDQGYQTFHSGTPVHLGWEKRAKLSLAFHCSCEEESDPVDVQYEKFKQQHVDPKVSSGNDTYCNRMMASLNSGRQKLKPINTFIHARTRDVREVCDIHAIKNVHRSVRLFNLTVCKQFKESQNYKATNCNKHIKIKCERHKPVHFVGEDSEI
ncbi:hypothetical protein AGOR_G00076040 [Albula goreensis]|uniref:Ribonuclease A-domain domain-containing protein n=1 Tax=Albula goreensis TaxID=1534307 RepID=A0A8T3DWX7_9TELE|nr:hypothetical protein AGOR_G00076040 [Albula goreensis]